MDGSGITRREREQLQRRAEIVKAAAELFSQKGYHNVSMQEIAERAEFAVGTLYKFFRNKEELYREILLETSKVFYSALSAVLENGGDEYARIREYLRAKCRVFLENAWAVRLFLAESGFAARFSVKSELTGELRDFYTQTVQKLAAVFQEGIKKGIFQSQDPYCLAQALESMSNGLLFYWMEDPERRSVSPEVIEQIFFDRVYVGQLS